MMCSSMLLSALPMGAEEQPEKSEEWKAAGQALTSLQASIPGTLEKPPNDGAHGRRHAAE